MAYTPATEPTAARKQRGTWPRTQQSEITLGPQVHSCSVHRALLCERPTLQSSRGGLGTFTLWVPMLVYNSKDQAREEGMSQDPVPEARHGGDCLRMP